MPPGPLRTTQNVFSEASGPMTFFGKFEKPIFRKCTNIVGFRKLICLSNYWQKTNRLDCGKLFAYLFIHLSTYLVQLSIYLSTYLPVYIDIGSDIYIYIYRCIYIVHWNSFVGIDTP